MDSKKRIYFSKKEQLGLVSLLSAITLTFSIAFLIRYNTGEFPDSPEEQRLRAAWLAMPKYRADTKQNSGAAERTLFEFDPNTLDSSGFLRLGLRPLSIHYLLNWRRKGKRFCRPEELAQLYSLREEEYMILAPYIRIQAISRTYEETEWALLPSSVSLNTADSVSLVRLRGIGPYLAAKIIRYRQALGGFYEIEQLKEVYPFPDSTFTYLKTVLKIDPAQVTRLDINKAGLEELARHPYIGEKTAENIIRFRNALNKYENISQVREVPLMVDEKYRKIAPYFSIE